MTYARPCGSTGAGTNDPPAEPSQAAETTGPSNPSNPSASTATAPASVSVSTRRRTGYPGSNGRYAAPARHTPNNPASRSTPRPSTTPTTEPGTTPTANNRAATTSARANNSAYEKLSPPAATATASGVNTACA